jgi:hypothetical protein
MLPFAFVREQGAVRFAASGPTSRVASSCRSAVSAHRQVKKVAGEKYYAAKDGDPVRASDAGIIAAQCPRPPSMGRSGSR